MLEIWNKSKYINFFQSLQKMYIVSIFSILDRFLLLKYFLNIQKLKTEILRVRYLTL